MRFTPTIDVVQIHENCCKGAIVEMSPEGEPHAYSSGEAGDYLAKLLGERAKIRHAKTRADV